MSLRGGMVVAIFIVYESPSEEEFCTKIEENAQILMPKYAIDFFFWSVTLCPKISCVKV